MPRPDMLALGGSAPRVPLDDWFRCRPLSLARTGRPSRAHGLSLDARGVNVLVGNTHEGLWSPTCIVGVSSSRIFFKRGPVRRRPPECRVRIRFMRFFLSDNEPSGEDYRGRCRRRFDKQFSLMTCFTARPRFYYATRRL
ncbi:unnamed protein product, partial [Iphiclides podalirius]